MSNQSVLSLQALAPIGALLGGPIAGWIADHAGRKAALMLVGIPYLVGYLMMVYAHFINQALVFKVVLLVGRFFTGLGLGWSCLATPVSIVSAQTPRRTLQKHLQYILICSTNDLEPRLHY